MSVAPDIRVLVVQHFPVAGYGSAHFLNACDGITVVGMASTGREGLALAQQHLPDIVVSCLELPDTRGVDLIDAIRMIQPAARFIVMTSFSGDDSIHQALNAGAHGYLTKDMPLAALADAVTQVHAGQQVLPTQIEKTLSDKGYVSSIFRQLGATSRTEAAAIAARRGIAHVTGETASLDSID